MEQPPRRPTDWRDAMVVRLAATRPVTLERLAAAPYPLPPTYDDGPRWIVRAGGPEATDEDAEFVIVLCADVVELDASVALARAFMH